MLRSSGRWLLIIGIVGLALSLALFGGRYLHDAASRPEDKPAELKICYPFDATLFPPDIAAPTFRWKDSLAKNDTWRIAIRFSDGRQPMGFEVERAEWTPTDVEWADIKCHSTESDTEVIVVGASHAAPDGTRSTGTITFRTSQDEVGAPLFYREVNLPFSDAVRDPSRIRWRFGAISSKQRPPVVLHSLPVCGNCHSFSADGKTLAMDIDSANDKGSYAITPITEEIVLDKSKIITWSDYKREDGQRTFGLLAQISPDGKYAISMVKDRHVTVSKPELMISQLFFPVKGILAVYDRRTRAFTVLPGADNPEFVHGNPIWSPDGKTILFARARAYNLKITRSKDSLLLSPEEAKEFLSDGKTFLFDLYRVPFNDGKGGKAEPLAGAAATA